MAIDVQQHKAERKRQRPPVHPPPNLVPPSPDRHVGNERKEIHTYDKERPKQAMVVITFANQYSFVGGRRPRLYFVLVEAFAGPPKPAPRNKNNHLLNLLLLLPFANGRARRPRSWTTCHRLHHQHRHRLGRSRPLVWEKRTRTKWEKTGWRGAAPPPSAKLSPEVHYLREKRRSC